MISVNDVFVRLSAYSDMSEFNEDDLLPSCEDGLSWVTRRLRPTADENDPLIAITAAAIAHFYFYLRRLTETDKYDSYKIGDITVNQDPHRQYQIEKDMRREAIANASSILKDGEFCFYAG